ncbi:lipase/ esterase [Armillaria fumosa]|nr:lipase/ esterase [Armillaria fumosa]
MSFISSPRIGETCDSSCATHCIIHEAARRQLHALIDHYATPGVAPPSARMSPRLKIQDKPSLRLWDWWKYGWFVATKATQMTGDVLTHAFWGPRKKSWGIEMTLISGLMRGAGRHTALMDLPSIRLFMGLGGLAPLPSDALVTPVTFRVRKRRLRGILADFDSKETGRRELSGEWVVAKKTWHRLQSEWKASQNSRKGPGQSLRPGKKTERVVLYIHGGAYYVGSPASQRQISVPLAQHTDARVFALDYRLAPESQFPDPLHDAVSGYLRLVEDLNIPPGNIIISGDSAGGGLSLALLLYLRDNDYPMPGGAILMSPWVDLTMSCESWDSNAGFDVIPVFSPADYMNPVAQYLGPQVERYLTHPYASPLFGDLKGLPPLLIQSGDSEVLRDEITLFAHKATLAGVEVRHELYEDAVHVFQLFPFLEVCARAFMSMDVFVHQVLPNFENRSPKIIAPNAEEVIAVEINNDNAVVLDCEGIATPVAAEGFKEKLEHCSDDDCTSSNSSSVSTDDTKRRPPPLSLNKPPGQRPKSFHGTVPEKRNGNTARYIIPHPEWESVPGQAPSPSLRRSFKRTNSYTDISRLIENWTHSGPANQTLVYKHPEP